MSAAADNTFNDIQWVMMILIMRYHDCFSDLTPDCSNSYAIVGMIRFYDISNFPLSVSRNINTGDTDV